MSASQDIRDWLRANGHQVPDRGRIAGDLRAEYEAAHGNGDAPADVPDEPMLIVPDDDGPGVDAEPPAVAEVKAESPPRPPRNRRSILQRKPRDSKQPARRMPRISLENLIGSGWGLAAMALARNPQAVPVGRVMSMQAPVAGVIVDDMVKGTAVDRLLQPLARAGERGEKAVALVGPPLITGMITMHPEWYPALRPMLKMSLMSWMAISGPAMKKAAQRAERMTDEYGVTEADLDGMIEALFSDIALPVRDSPDEDAAVRRARGD